MFSIFERFQSQRSRRLVATFHIASLITLLVITWFVDSYLPAIPLFALIAIATLTLVGSTRGITNGESDLLDEQQIATRNEGYRRAYMLGVMVAFFGGYSVARWGDTTDAFELGMWLSVFMSTLPTVIVAWNLPGDVGDEE